MSSSITDNTIQARIIFWGTPEFSLPALQTLVRAGYKVVGVVTNPDEVVGRKQVLTPSPVKILAEKNNLPIFQPVKLSSWNWKDELPEADLFIISAFGKIIPKELLEYPRYGALNIHPSLLPCWRGPSPIQFTVLNADAEAGITIIKMDELMDHGAVITASSFLLPVLSKPTYKELHDKLAVLGADLLIKILPDWLQGKITPQEQDEFKATYSKILKKDDGRIDWSRPADMIERQIRAFHIWPGSFSVWPDGKNYLRLRVDEAEIYEEEPVRGSPGFVWQDDQGSILIRTGVGSLKIKRVTPAGAKTMGIGEFTRGHPNFVGSNLI